MKKIFLFLTILSCALSSFAQETGSVKGKVLDGELFSEPLLMASVSLQNTAEATTTNFNGNFEIENLTPGEYQLVIQFLGYESLELPVTIVAGEEYAVFETLYAKTLSVPTLTALSKTDDPSLRAEAKSVQKR